MMNLHYAINRDIPKDTYIKQVALSTNEVIVLTLNGKIYLMDLNMTEKVSCIILIKCVLLMGVLVSGFKGINSKRR